jgi:hypothetical protein
VNAATTEDRWREAIGRTLDVIAGVTAEVDVRLPRTIYPLRLRLWWRVVGVPENVRDAQYDERKQRADLHFRLLHERLRRLELTG